MRKSMEFKKTGLFFLMIAVLIGGCKKEDSSKKDPVITWENPAFIYYGTALSDIELDAVADVPGTFVYTPPAGTILSVGNNQVLKAEFTPTDQENYNTVSKTVYINVLTPGSGGTSNTVFNSALTYGTMTDVDGNTYKTIVIGTQTWMAENLRTTKYRNGDEIGEISGNSAWSLLASGAYCNYNNTFIADSVATYGRLYNWYALTDSRNIAPEGWHVPTDAEWTTLTTYLGGESTCGGKLKEVGFLHWLSPNYSATNESGFSALPGGQRNKDGVYSEWGISGTYWTSTEASYYLAWQRVMSSDGGFCSRNSFQKQFGYSVRLVKDY